VDRDDRVEERGPRHEQAQLRPLHLSSQAAAAAAAATSQGSSMAVVG
jgi:hypothetical protein